MKTRTGKVLRLAILAILFLSSALAYAQGSGQGQGQQKPPQPPAQPGQPAQQPAKPATTETSAPPVNAEEEAAYKALFEMKGSEAERLIQAGEEFLKKYPESRYRESIYTRLTSAYMFTSQDDKMFAAGEKALELNKDNVDVLALMALAMPRRWNPRALDAAQQLDRVEKYAKRAMEIIAAIQKPEGMTDEDFTTAKNEKLYMCHSGLGVTYFQKQRFADSASELEQATKLTTIPDVVDYYVLGLAYKQVKRYSDAAAAFGRCSEIPSSLTIA